MPWETRANEKHKVQLSTCTGLGLNTPVEYSSQFTAHILTFWQISPSNSQCWQILPNIRSSLNLDVLFVQNIQVTLRCAIIACESSSSANCTAIGHELSPRLPVLCHACNLYWRWWVCLADYAGNVLMKHQLWATGLTFAMFRVEKGVPACWPIHSLVSWGYALRSEAAVVESAARADLVSLSWGLLHSRRNPFSWYPGLFYSSWWWSCWVFLQAFRLMFTLHIRKKGSIDRSP